MLTKFCLTGLMHGSMQMQLTGCPQYVKVTEDFLFVIRMQYIVCSRHLPAIM